MSRAQYGIDPTTDGTSWKVTCSVCDFTEYAQRFASAEAIGRAHIADKHADRASVPFVRYGYRGKIHVATAGHVRRTLCGRIDNVGSPITSYTDPYAPDICRRCAKLAELWEPDREPRGYYTAREGGFFD